MTLTAVLEFGGELRLDEGREVREVDLDPHFVQDRFL